MNCIRELVNDINRFYSFFDGIYLRRYENGLCASFASTAKEIDIYLYDDCIAYIDKYKVLHICATRVKSDACASRVMNILSAGLDDSFTFATC